MTTTRETRVPAAARGDDDERGRIFRTAARTVAHGGHTAERDGTMVPVRPSNF